MRLQHYIAAITLLFLLNLANTPVQAGILKEKRTGPQQLPIKLPHEELFGEDISELNVHVIAHTHDDVGWLKTVDEYYIGANQSIQDAGVQYIIDNVIQALQEDPTRKFIYVEIAFFERWWNEQTERTKQIVRGLVASGQLEFINGGWCMNDEANTHYAAIIDQMTHGHQFLYREFGVRPRIGWHIDPFGHASTQASLFAQMGFDGFFFGRIEYDDHAIRNETKNLEFVWRGSSNFGKETEIWTHVLYTDYCYLHGFAFEWTDPPIQDDLRLFDYNLKERVDLFASMVRQRAWSNRHNNVLIPFGCDFQFENAHINFKNMDKIVNYVNSHPEYKMTLKYSTPSIYLDAVHHDDITWTVKTDDFFPYADEEHAFWTGYFTSRPAIKGYVRNTNNLAHTMDKVFTSSGMSIQTDSHGNSKYSDLFSKVAVMDDAYGIAQHHDAVAGTEQQHVANDYAKRMYIGGEAAFSVINEVLGQLTTNFTQTSSNIPQFDFCPLLNVSQCPILDQVLSTGGTVSVVMYNPLAWHRTDFYAELVVPTSKVQVYDYKGNSVQSQVQPNDDVQGSYTLFFATDLPPLGFSTYFITLSSSGQESTTFFATEEQSDGLSDTSIANDIITLTFSSSTNRLSHVSNGNNGLDLSMVQNYLWWNASAGNNNDTQASGAYIFRPNGTKPFELINGNPKIVSQTGPLVQEVRQSWNSWLSSKVRLYKGQSRVEFQTTIGAIDISDNLGKEVVSRWTTGLKTQGYLWTDSEGMEMMTRRRNYRPWKDYNITEPIASNYYPMNTAAFIRDLSETDPNKQTQVTFITDRSRGCGSIDDGQFENMIQRRLLYDDGRGVSEPLNETETVRTVEWMYLQSSNQSARYQRHSALFLNNPPTLAFAKAPSVSLWRGNYITNYTPLQAELPANVHLLNFKTLEDNQVLVRLHHIFSVGEDSELSQPVSVNLNNLFNNLWLESAVEMTLSANQPKSELHRLNWKTDQAEGAKFKLTPVADWSSVVLRPMEIRTFLIRYQNY